MNDNKLIAEFMGAEEVKHEKFDGSRFLLPYEGDKNWFLIALNDMEYDTSWDWLMPVIEKCLVGEAEQSDEISNTTIKNIYEGICNQDISHAYKSAVEFIKTYNNDTI